MKKKEAFKQYLFVIRQLNRKENSHKNSETKLGKLWNIINPLVFMIVMSEVYGSLLKKSMPNFQIYYFIGYIVFTFIKDGTTMAMHSIVSNKNLLIRTKNPMNIFVIERVYTAMINMMYSCIAFIPLIFVFHLQVGVTYIVLIPSIIITFFFILGAGKILAVLYVYFQDIDYLYSIFMTLMMFGSAIFFPAERLSGVLQRVIAWNPIYIAITIARQSIMDGVFSPITLWIKLLAWAVLLYGFGSYVFEKNRNHIMQKL